MEIVPVLLSQYRASLEMLRQTVAKCPPELWSRPTDANPTWRTAYHALFYTQLYLQPAIQDFRAWPKHRDQAELLGKFRSYPPYEPIAELEPYTPAEIQETIDWILAQLGPTLSRLDLDGPSGFDWLPIGKLELQFYNLRHLMQHTGELFERLAPTGVDLPWVVMG